MKTLLLGLDGLDPDLVDEFDLPNIESVGEGFEIDTHGNSGPSWVSVMTGLRPNEHGIHKLEPQQNQQSWGGVPIWEKVDGYSGIANVPLTYPPREMRGWIVTGLMTPRNSIYTYPRELYKELDELGYRVDVWIDNHRNHPHGHFGTVPFSFTQEDKQALLIGLENVMLKRTEGFVHLIENHDTDFMFLCYTSLDRVQHLAFDDKEVLEKFYKLLDHQVGVILDKIGDEVEIFVNSDHGFRLLDMPDTDIKGEHRMEGYGATNTGEKFRNLEELHNKVVESSNRTDVEGRLEDLGYL